MTSINLVRQVRVLSIQSHVVSGYVGNKSACFPLQVLGFEVDTINSVQFSNHTGYKTFLGHVLDSNELGALMEGLKSNKIDTYSHLLTGYVGSKSFLKAIQANVKYLKEKNPNLVYVCDPVMGDDGKMYVPADLLEIYRDDIIPLADIVTPNQFEAELLSGSKIHNVNDALEVMKWFHSKGAKTVILTSTVLGSEAELVCLASSIENGSNVKLRINIPRLSMHFTGTGDLFTSLILGWMHISGNDLQLSIENTVGTMQKVLQRTSEHAEMLSKKEGISVQPYMKELKLIQSLKDIQTPCKTVKAIQL